MNWGQIIGIVCGGLGGSALTIFWRRGKVAFDQSKLEFHYVTDENTLLHHIEYFTLHIQFSNTSGNTMLLKDLKARFYTGEVYYELKMKGRALSPSIIMEPKIQKEEKFTFQLVGDVSTFSMLHLQDHTAFFELTYINNGRKQTQFIYGSDLEMMKGWLAF